MCHLTSSGRCACLGDALGLALGFVPDFKEYQRGHGGQRKHLGPTVTVQRRGLLSLSEDAWTELGSPDTVTFLVDRDERLIGFRPCRRNAKSGNVVRGPQHIISAIPLLKAVEADLSESRRYTLKVEEGLPPYIDLNEDAPVVTSNRRKASPAATA